MYQLTFKIKMISYNIIRMIFKRASENLKMDYRDNLFIFRDLEEVNPRVKCCAMMSDYLAWL